MQSFAFPDIFTSSKTRIVTDNEATRNNVRLVLMSNKNTLFGDPDFGSSIIKLLWEQNDNPVIKDVAVDYVYNCIVEFIPQLLLERKNIDVTSSGTKLNITFKAVNMLNYTTDIYNIDLMGDATY